MRYKHTRAESSQKSGSVQNHQTSSAENREHCPDWLELSMSASDGLPESICPPPSHSLTCRATAPLYQSTPSNFVNCPGKTVRKEHHCSPEIWEASTTLTRPLRERLEFKNPRGFFSATCVWEHVEFVFILVKEMLPPCFLPYSRGQRVQTKMFQGVRFLNDSPRLKDGKFGRLCIFSGRCNHPLASHLFLRLWNPNHHEALVNWRRNILSEHHYLVSLHEKGKQFHPDWKKADFKRSVSKRVHCLKSSSTASSKWIEFGCGFKRIQDQRHINCLFFGGGGWRGVSITCRSINSNENQNVPIFGCQGYHFWAILTHPMCSPLDSHSGWCWGTRTDPTITDS